MLSTRQIRVLSSSGDYHGTVLVEPAHVGKGPHDDEAGFENFTVIEVH
jgi:hypothetical protein